jgi:uncharacterized protein (DUF1697 family)
VTTYVALLRGINVSGQKLIKMEHLKSALAQLPISQVQTYIQSGNIVFEAEEQETGLLERMIADLIEQTYSFQVPVVIRTAAELAAVAATCPYKPDTAETSGVSPVVAPEAAVAPAVKEKAKLYVAFLSEQPAEAQIAVLQTFHSAADEYTVMGREVYILCKEGYGKSLFSNNFLESKLKVKATTRNWATVNKLIAMSSS